MASEHTQKITWANTFSPANPHGSEEIKLFKQISLFFLPMNGLSIEATEHFIEQAKQIEGMRRFSLDPNDNWGCWRNGDNLTLWSRFSRATADEDWGEMSVLMNRLRQEGIITFAD